MKRTMMAMAAALAALGAAPMALAQGTVRVTELPQAAATSGSDFALVIQTGTLKRVPLSLITADGTYAAQSGTAEWALASGTAGFADVADFANGVEWSAISGVPEIGTGNSGSLVTWEQFDAHAAENTLPHLNVDERAAMAGVGLGAYPPTAASPLVTLDAMQQGAVNVPATSVVLTNEESVQWAIDSLGSGLGNVQAAFAGQLHALNSFALQATGNAYELQIAGEIAAAASGQYPIDVGRAYTIWLWGDQAFTPAVNSASGTVLEIRAVRAYTPGQSFSGVARIDGVTLTGGGVDVKLDVAVGDYKALVVVGADFADLRGSAVNVGN
jgi:hypothetical protein